MMEGGGGEASLKTALFEDAVNTFRQPVVLYFEQFFRYSNKQYAIPYSCTLEAALLINK
jgi:hypothetical protein